MQIQVNRNASVNFIESKDECDTKQNTDWENVYMSSTVATES